MARLRFRMKNTKTLLFLFICLLGLARDAFGAQVDAGKAAAAVRGWLRLDAAPLGTALGDRHVAHVDTFADSNGAPLYHVVYLAPSGYVVVAGEDQIDPILAFVKQGRFSPGPTQPLATLVSRDASARVKRARAIQGKSSRAEPSPRWQRLNQSAAAVQSTAVTVQANVQPKAQPNVIGSSQISDLRVAPFIQSEWSQTLAFGSGVACFNYFIPPYAPGTATNYGAGCVAVAMGQLLYYYRYPSVGVGTGAFEISVDKTNMMRNLRGGDGFGGPYNWANMPAVPSNPTLAQCQELGSLLYDAGVASHTAYTADSVSAGMADAKTALLNTFKYKNAIVAEAASLNVGVDLMSMVNPNLDARHPVIFQIDDGKSGYVIVCDGYGYSLGTLYHHINVGWGGIDDGWYQLPIFDLLGSETYLNISACLFNVFTNSSGEIISGRVLDTNGVPVVGATVTAIRPAGDVYTAVTDSHGVYALDSVPSGSVFTLTATNTDYFASTLVCTNGTSLDYASTCGNLWGVDLVITPAQGPPTVITQAQDEVVAPSVDAIFSVQAAGALPLYYQWQCLPVGSSTWITLSDGAGYSGTQTATLTVSAPGQSMNGTAFRCVVSNSLSQTVGLPGVLRILTPPALAFATLAGYPGTAGATDGSNAAAAFYHPRGIVVGVDGALYITDLGNHVVRQARLVGSDWVVSTIAGLAGTPGTANGLGSNARFNGPYGIAADSGGSLYVADTGSSTIRRLTPTPNGWSVTTVAGTPGVVGGQDGVSSFCLFRYPTGVAVDARTNLFVADQANSTIRRLSMSGSSWVSSTIAGSVGNTGSVDGTNNNSRFSNPCGVAVDSAGHVYVADSGNCTIRRLVQSGTNWSSSTIAGLAHSSGSADGLGSAARFYNPTGIAIDPGTNLYVADCGNHTIRTIMPGGTNWVVGTSAGLSGNSGASEGLGSVARFNGPYAIAVDGNTNVYVADSLNNTIRGAFPYPAVAGAQLSTTVRISSWSATQLMTLHWAAIQGHSYQIQYKTNLNQTNWINLSTATAASPTASALVPCGPDPQRFYRVLAQ